VPVTKPKTWNEWKYHHIYIDGRDRCEVWVKRNDEWVQCGAPVVDGCHGVFKRSTPFKKFVDQYWNMVMGCKNCNRVEMNDRKWKSRKRSFLSKVEYYGDEFMKDVLDNAPAGIKRGGEWDKFYNLLEYGG
jgi:hypothetical protein